MHTIFVGKHEGKKSLVIPKRRRKYNIKMGPRERGCDDVDRKMGQ